MSRGETGVRPGTAAEAIAVVGMSGRFPGAADVHALWRNLRDGVESRTELSEDDLVASGVSKAALAHPAHVRAGFLLEYMDRFDSEFFGFNPREADLLDPQHRLLLEAAWLALEDAGYDSERFAGPVGVFAGGTHSGYLNNNVLKNAAVVRQVGSAQAIHGSVADYMVTRVAYKLNLRGPACFVQTACSTSLVAIHMACQSLRSRECDMALAGGVSVAVPHRAGYVYQQGGMQSPDGHCRAFDADARGTVFGSGVGVVVLRRLEDALEQGDQILAVVRGSAVNNDGALKVGFTAPSVGGQARVVGDALASAGLTADDIDYVEAHGTGTELGDPIEVAALTRAFRATSDRRGDCPIGSIKPNLGHLDAAAGVSSAIKAILALGHRELPPSINCDRPNPKIDFADSPFFVNTRLRAWESRGRPRRASVSAFGFGGTNAYLILEEPPERPAAAAARPWQLLPLSARDETALGEATDRLAERLESGPDLGLADAAWTLQVGRRAFGARRAVVARSGAEAVRALRGEAAGLLEGRAATSRRELVFMFPGQGTQHVDMGRELYETEPVFRETVDGAAECLRPDLGFDLRSVLYPGPAETAAATERLRRTAVTQPALFAIEWALARLWMSWGLHPTACIGHSIGEYVAACVAGVLEPEDALHLVALRGRLMERMPEGVMLAVPLARDEVESELGEGLWLSAVNGPALSVVSGAATDVEALRSRLESRGVTCRALHTSHAFHSGLMEGAVAPFTEAVGRLALRPPRIPYVSNLTGDWITEAQATDPVQWGRQIREPVRFSEGLERVLAKGEGDLLEVGPGSTLETFARQLLSPRAGHVVLASLKHAKAEGSDVQSVLQALARLWLGGADVDWAALRGDERRRRVSLPGYAFQRRRHWVDRLRGSREALRMASRMGEAEDLGDWFHVPTWQRQPRLRPAAAEHAACRLVFGEPGPLEARVREALSAGDGQLIRVEAGEAFARRGDGVYTVRPGALDDYRALLRELRASRRVPDAVAHLWCAAPGDEAPASAVERGYYSLLFLARALGETGLETPVRLDVVTAGAWDVTGEEGLIPERAAVRGPCRVIPQELEAVTCRHFDLDPGEVAGGPSLDLLVTALGRTGGSPVVALRRGRAWTREFAPVRIPEQSSPEPLRDGGVYLITGGLGGVGLQLARDLAARHRARLVLLSRRGLPPRTDWERLAAAGAPEARGIRAVRELEELGAEVVVESADVADADRLRSVVDAAIARFGHLHGVIHAAGVAGAGLIQLKERAAAAAVLAPKVEGTRALAAALAGRELDFLVLASSLASVVGGLGQVDYTAANAFLDAFAHHHARTTGVRTVAINWNAWREAGMAVETELPDGLRDAIRESMLRSGVTNAQGVETFRRILTGTGESQVAGSPRDVNLLANPRALAELFQPSADPGAGTEEAAKSSAHSRPGLATPYAPPATEAQRAVCRIWEESLGVDRVGIHDSFFDLGGHSLLAVGVMARVNKTLGTEIPVARLYEGLTVSFLAGLAGAPDSEDTEAAPRVDRIQQHRDRSRRRKEIQQRRRVARSR